MMVRLRSIISLHNRCMMKQMWLFEEYKAITLVHRLLTKWENDNSSNLAGLLPQLYVFTFSVGSSPLFQHNKFLLLLFQLWPKYLEMITASVETITDGPGNPLWLWSDPWNLSTCPSLATLIVGTSDILKLNVCSSKATSNLLFFAIFLIQGLLFWICFTFRYFYWAALGRHKSGRCSETWPDQTDCYSGSRHLLCFVLAAMPYQVDLPPPPSS